MVHEAERARPLHRLPRPPEPIWTPTSAARRTSMWSPCPPCSAAPTTARSRPGSCWKRTSRSVNVHVFNSCSASSGEVLTALKIRELASSPACPSRRSSGRWSSISIRCRLCFVLETLENLRKNGRLTKLQAVVTGALRIKLFMGATPEGEICKLGQALSMKQALSKLVDKIASDPNHRGRVPWSICHCNCKERAREGQGADPCQVPGPGEILVVGAGEASPLFMPTTAVWSWPIDKKRQFGLH